MSIKLAIKKKSNLSFLKRIGHLHEEVTVTHKLPSRGTNKKDESLPEWSEDESRNSRGDPNYASTTAKLDIARAMASKEGKILQSLGFGNIKKVGEGVMGKVFVGTWDSRDGVERAIKVVKNHTAVRELNAYRIISNAREKDPLIAKHFPEVEFTGIEPQYGFGIVIMELLEDDPNARQVIWDMFGGEEIWKSAAEEIEDNAAISIGNKKKQIVKRTEALITDPKSREALLNWITGHLPYEPTSMQRLLTADFRNMTKINQDSIDAVDDAIGYWVRNMEASMRDPDSRVPRYYGDSPEEYLEVIYRDYKGSATVINFITALVVGLLDDFEKSLEYDPDSDQGDWNAFMASLANILKEFINAARKWTPIGISPSSKDYRLTGANPRIAGAGYPGAKSVLQAIQRLYELTGLVAKDMHDGNVMVRYDTKDIVIVDVGLFKREKGWKPGMKESKQLNFLKLILARMEYEENFYKKNLAESSQSELSLEQEQKLLTLLTSDIESATQALEIIDAIDIGYNKQAILGKALAIANEAGYEKREVHAFLEKIVNDMLMANFNNYLAPKHMVKKEGRSKHHPAPGRHKKYFGSSVYDLPAMHGGDGGDAGGDGGGGDGNRKEFKKKKKRTLKIIRGKKK